MPRLITILFLLAGFVLPISAQDVFISNLPVEEKDNTLYFRLENTSFFKNNEYKAACADGYTLTGYWLRPKLIYSPVEKAQLELGWHYLRYNGSENATWSIPWFSAKIDILKNTRLIIGNLNNNQNHRLIQPIWEPERFLTDKPEAGFQILHNSERFYLDTWINWEQFILEDDPFQEHFTAGISSELMLSGSEKFRFSIPVQILFHHQGGEIDSSPLRVQTLMNTATGLNAEFFMNGFIRKAGLSFFYTTFKDQKQNNSLPFEKGDGFFLNGSAQTKIGRFGAGYWNSENFFGIKGMGLLQVVSGINAENEISQLDKELLFIFYDIKKEICKGITFGGRFEAWFEPEQDFFSNSAAIYLIVNQDFLLKRF